MKWFKHYSDASLDNKICQLEDEFGYVGYGVYWKILETCATQWDGKSDPVFVINKKKMKSILSVNYIKIESILSLGSVLDLFSVEILEKSYSIKIPNLLTIKDNHTRNLQVAAKLVSPNLLLEQNRTDKKRTEKKKVKCEFDLEMIYAGYPKKVGKALGLKKLEKIVTTKEIFNAVLNGAKDYSDLCKDNNTEQKYIKQFSTWVNGEHWNDEFETKTMVREDLVKAEQALLNA